MKQQEILDQINNLLKKHMANQGDGKFVDYFPPEELRERLRLDDRNGRGNWSRIFQWVQAYLDYSVKTGHPGFVNRMWATANLPSIVGEMVAAATNTSACTYESAPVSTLMEKYMIGEMLDLVGFTNGEGQMTTGSSNANMLAMMAARNEALFGVKEHGLWYQEKLVAFVSADAHYSMDKAANILGLGTRNLIRVAVSDNGEMDMIALETAIEGVIAAGDIPFFVGGTAGTTVRGAYDPIEQLLELRNRYHFWLHIDGAWGGAVIMSAPLRDWFLAGIEEVDSFTWDFHKMLGTSLMCNVFLINNRLHTLGRLCGAGDDSYLFHGDDSNEVLDLGAVSLQCGRRVDSLKWFLDWKYFGQEGFARRVERCFELCQYAEKVVQETPELELVLPRSSFNICFRYRAPEASANAVNLALRTRLHQGGTSLVGYAQHQGKLFLRLLLANPELTTDEVDRYFANLVATAKTLSGG